MITKQIILIQLTALLVCYLSVAISVETNQWNPFKWDDKSVFRFLISVFVVNSSILILSSILE